MRIRKPESHSLPITCTIEWIKNCMNERMKHYEWDTISGPHAVLV